MKYQNKIGSKEFVVQQNENSWQIDNKKISITKGQSDQLIVLRDENNNEHHAIIQHIDYEKNKVVVQINQKEIEVEVTDPIDQKMLSLGIDIKKLSKAKNIKAPMPGLILKTLVKTGQDIKAGEALFILEAMKMENVFKAPDDVTIKEILIKEGDTVDKNQELITFK